MNHWKYWRRQRVLRRQWVSFLLSQLQINVKRQITVHHWKNVQRRIITARPLQLPVWMLQLELRISVPGKSTIEKIHALTCIDKAIGWLEFIAIRNKTSHHVALCFYSEWLCHYPLPAKVVYDNGTKFTGHEFQELLERYGIKPVATTVRNPRSNGVIERVHLKNGRYALHHDLLWWRLVWRHAENIRCSSMGSPHHHQPIEQTLTLPPSLQSRHDF